MLNPPHISLGEFGSVAPKYLRNTVIPSAANLGRHLKCGHGSILIGPSSPGYQTLCCTGCRMSITVKRELDTLAAIQAELEPGRVAASP